MKYLIPFIVCLIFVIFATTTQAAEDKSGVKPQVISLPSGHGSIEGMGEAFEPQLNTSSASYSVKILLPPGVNVHKSELTFQYKSGLA